MTNVFYTLFFAASAVHCWALLRRRLGEGRRALVLAGLPVLGLLLLADTVECDYSGFGVLLVFLLYLAEGRRTQSAVLALAALLRYGLVPWAEILALHGPRSVLHCAMVLCFALLPAGLICLYNGQRGGRQAKWTRWAFYVFYPAHLLLLAALRMAL